jgi:hypothetical protein
MANDQRPVYFTDLAVTVNTHARSRFETVNRNLAILRTAVRGLSDVAELERLMEWRDEQGEILPGSTLGSIGLEVGQRFHLIHAHFILRIKASERISINGINRRLQQWFNDRVPYANGGCYVRAQLMPSSAAKNYAVKNPRQRRPRSSRLPARSEPLVAPYPGDLDDF